MVTLNTSSPNRQNSNKNIKLRFIGSHFEALSKHKQFLFHMRTPHNNTKHVTCWQLSQFEDGTADRFIIIYRFINLSCMLNKIRREENKAIRYISTWFEFFKRRTTNSKDFFYRNMFLKMYSALRCVENSHILFCTWSL